MTDFEKFGCQAPLNDCRMVENYQRLYETTGMEDLNIPAPRIMELCLRAQARLREVAAFKEKTYAELLRKYSEGETGNCPFYVIGCEDSKDYPTLLH